MTPGSPPAPSVSPPAAATTPLIAWLRTVLLACVLIPVAIFVMVAWWGLGRAQSDAQATARRATQFAAEHARNTLDIAAEIAQITARLTSGTDEEIDRQEPAIRQRLADISVGLPIVVNLNVWDAQGRPLVRSDAPPERSGLVRDREYFARLRDTPQQLAPYHGFTLSEVIVGRQTGRELMNLAMRRPDRDGRFDGVIGVSLAPAFFRDYYRSLTEENRRISTLALVRSDGTLLARWPPPPDGRKRMAADNPVLPRILAGEAEGVDSRSHDGGRATRLVSFRQVPGYPAYVVAGLDRGAVFAQWRHFLLLLGGALTAITIVLVSVCWLALRKTRQETAASLALRDEIRRRSAAEKAMLESQRLETLAVLTGSVAHDFNNLLAIVNTSLHVHTRKHPGEAGEPQIRAMSRAIRSGARLTRQLLSFSGKQALQPEPIALQEWLPATAELIRTTLGPQVALRQEVAASTGTIRVDPGELELALINLAVNARHALPDGGHFTITAEDTADGQVQLRVQDDGVGIPAHVLPRVLEPFFTTRERGTGSGLGLSQVQGLMQQSGGSVEIRSEPGAGTCIDLRFPRLGDAAQAEQAEDATPLTLAGRVLLVEDNDEVAQATAEMLAAAGLRVRRASHPREALDMLAAEALPDVVLSDIAMPGDMNGIAFAFRLREMHPGLPVILATGYAEQLQHAVQGGLEVLSKPLSPEYLLRRLQELMQERRP
ncbi:response regulator [Xylophilus rhododendri]|uniref:histidine kinase n=1 Tax=Xylophilus rhododendri TaxID=2697032 RepID=A0A857J8Y1_9BURK|nr:ATP-binding protein [Xylophilus rhododendri]QHI99509.1 response regulator [Xylophilus rhododendri]